LLLSPASIRFKPWPFNRAVSLAALIISGALLALLLPKLALAKAPAHLTFDSDYFDFGKVEEGVEINHTFTLKNTGDSMLRIFDVSSTCGCTIPRLTKKILRPGESTRLRIVIDTAMKQDAVIKKVLVTSNDPAHRVSTLSLRLDVKDPHTGMTGETAAKIFSNERCAACHVAQGVGLFGRELYRADCAMCHGVKAAGAAGPPLLGPYQSSAYSTKMRMVLSYGSKTQRSMPGFLAQAGGPLDKTQIDSILKYLADLSEKKVK